MKTKLGIIGVLVMLSFIAAGSCDEFDIESCAGTNYVNVVVEARVHVAITDYTNYTDWAGAEVQVKITKAGGENVTENRTTDSGGNTEPVNATFKVYNEQPVEVYVTVIDGPMPEFMLWEYWEPQHFMTPDNFKRLEWGTIFTVGYGGTYNWYPLMDIKVQPVYE